MAWHTQHLSRRALFPNARMLSSTAAQGLHNQLQKPCLLPFWASSRFPTKMLCSRSCWRDAPSARQGSVQKKVTRKTHLRLKSSASTDADRSPTHPARLLLLRMALFQTMQLQTFAYDTHRQQMRAPAAFRLRTHVRLPVRKHPLALPATSRHQQRMRCITFYTSFNSRHAHDQQLNAMYKSGATQFS